MCKRQEFLDTTLSFTNEIKRKKTFSQLVSHVNASRPVDTIFSSFSSLCGSAPLFLARRINKVISLMESIAKVIQTANANKTGTIRLNLIGFSSEQQLRASHLIPNIIIIFTAKFPLCVSLSLSRYLSRSVCSRHYGYKWRFYYTAGAAVESLMPILLHMAIMLALAMGAV